MVDRSGIWRVGRQIFHHEGLEAHEGEEKGVGFCILHELHGELSFLSYCGDGGYGAEE